MDTWKSTTARQKLRRGEDAGARRGREVAKHCVFPMFCGSGGSINRLAKAAGAEPAREMKDEKAHSVVARSTFGSQNVQITTRSGHRCRPDVGKAHAIVAGSTLASQKW